MKSFFIWLLIVTGCCVIYAKSDLAMGTANESTDTNQLKRMSQEPWWTRTK